MKRQTLLALAFVALTGCADKTGILVEATSSDLAVPGDVDALRFVAMSDNGRSVDQTFAISTDWPHSLTILPGEGDSSISLTVSALRGGIVQTERMRANEMFELGVTRRIVVDLSRTEPLPDGGLDGGGDGGTTVPTLILSEYVEGSSGFNKYIEIYNATSAAIPLTGHSLRIFFGTSTNTIALDGTIPAGGTYVVSHTQAALAGAVANLTSDDLLFNGNDPVSLQSPRGEIDVIGAIGDGAIFGENTTLVRNSGVENGRTGAWAPSEWHSLATDTHELGRHTP